LNNLSDINMVQSEFEENLKCQDTGKDEIEILLCRRQKERNQDDGKPASEGSPPTEQKGMECVNVKTLSSIEPKADGSRRGHQAHAKAKRSLIKEATHQVC